MSNQANTQLICNLYRLESVISETPQTKICSVLDEAGCRYAAKLTSIEETEGGSFQEEFEVFRYLTNGQIAVGLQSHGQTPEGFPNVYYVGNHANEYNVIVMDILYPDLLYLCHHLYLSVSTCQNLACDMLDRLEELHRHGFVHRDVEPKNFMMNHSGKVHLIDFGLSKRYRDIRSTSHLPEAREPFLSGTSIYSSIHAHRLVTQSRRDDLESLGYSLIKMIKEKLPWEDAYVYGGDVNQRISYMKENTPLRTLCSGLPIGIYDYMITVCNMSYDEYPNYRVLREMLKSE